jgi:large subunit ribosomal protein L4
VDSLDLPEPKTRALREILLALGVQGRVLLVLAEADQLIWRCGRNIPALQIRPAVEVNAHDVLLAHRVIMTKDAVPRLEARLS